MPKGAHGDRSRRIVGILLSHTRASLCPTMQKNAARRYADADTRQPPHKTSRPSILDVPRGRHPGFGPRGCAVSENPL